jgi:5-methylcytosine-specific restriction endonuclease McrA
MPGNRPDDATDQRSSLLERWRASNRTLPAERSIVRYTDEELTDIFDRTNGRCHLCFARLAFSNYGYFGERGAWEVEHSIPRALGGTNRLNNLYAACIVCNRSKGTQSTRAVRGWRGYSAAPFSTAKRTRLRRWHALLGAVIGYLAGAYVGASSFWQWLLVLGLAWIAYQLEPDPQRR